MVSYGLANNSLQETIIWSILHEEDKWCNIAVPVGTYIHLNVSERFSFFYFYYLHHRYL